MTVSIHSTRVTICRRLDKKIINNRYIPLHLDHNIPDSNNFFNYLKRKVIGIINRFIKV